jgi:hypothetical protein
MNALRIIVTVCIGISCLNAIFRHMTDDEHEPVVNAIAMILSLTWRGLAIWMVWA